MRGYLGKKLYNTIETSYKVTLSTGHDAAACVCETIIAPGVVQIVDKDAIDPDEDPKTKVPYL